MLLSSSPGENMGILRIHFVVHKYSSIGLPFSLAFFKCRNPTFYLVGSRCYRPTVECVVNVALFDTYHYQAGPARYRVLYTASVMISINHYAFFTHELIVDGGRSNGGGGGG